MMRRLTSWVIYRPRNLLIAVGAVGVGLMVLSTFFDTPAQRSDTSPIEAMTDAMPTFDIDDVPAFDLDDIDADDMPASFDVGDPPEGPEAVDHGPALGVAERFVAAWLDTDAEDWPDGAKRHATAEFASLLDTIDPANVPDGTVSGSQVTVDGMFYLQVDVLIGEEETVAVELTAVDGGWRVLNLS